MRVGRRRQMASFERTRVGCRSRLSRGIGVVVESFRLELERVMVLGVGRWKYDVYVLVLVQARGIIHIRKKVSVDVGVKRTARGRQKKQAGRVVYIRGRGDYASTRARDRSSRRFGTEFEVESRTAHRKESKKEEKGERDSSALKSRFLDHQVRMGKVSLRSRYHCRHSNPSADSGSDSLHRTTRSLSRLPNAKGEKEAVVKAEKADG
jgi:hypothetical protein